MMSIRPFCMKWQPLLSHCFWDGATRSRTIAARKIFLWRSFSDLPKSHQLTLFDSEEAATPLGKVSVHVPFSVQVRPLDLDDHPEMNKLLLKLVASVADNVSREKLEQMFTLDVQRSPATLELKASLTELGLQFCRSTENPFVCVVQLPLHSSVEVKTQDLGSVIVNDMESNSISVSTEKGGIHCKRLKCGSMKFETNDGDILCTGVMQGNIDIKTNGTGSVTGMRFQGNKINVATQTGSVDIAAIYAEHSNFLTVGGNLNLENYHGNGTISVKEGNLNVSGMDGSLKVDMEKGNVDVQISRFRSLHISNKKGNIEVRLPENLQASLELEATNLKIEKRLRVQGGITRKVDRQFLSGSLGSGKGPLMMLLAKEGTIHLSIQDWLSSLQLGGVIPEISNKGSTHEPQPLGR